MWSTLEWRHVSCLHHSVLRFDYETFSTSLFSNKLASKTYCLCDQKEKRPLNTVVSLYISNDHGRTYKFDFSIFDRKYPFSANFVQKIKVVSLTLISVPRQIQICRILWYSLFSALDRKHPFWSNLVQKIKSVSLS